MNAKRIFSSLAVFTASAGFALAGIPNPDIDETIGELPDGKCIIFTHSVTIDAAPTGTEITSQGTVSGSNFSPVLTDDPDVGGGADPTITPLLVNQPPIAGPDIIDRFPTSSLKIPVATLLGNDSDPEGNTPLTVSNVQYTGGNGATLQQVGDIVFYDPKGHQGDDTFAYDVTDSKGAVTSGVNVLLQAVTDDNPIHNFQGSSVSVTFTGQDANVTAFGIPGRVYRVQARDTNSPNAWFDLATIPANANGRIDFTDPGPLPPTRIYRIVHP